MKTEKLTYESPMTRPFVVRFEGRIMTGSQWNTATPKDLDWGDDVDLE